jgi:hypothetical protein
MNAIVLFKPESFVEGYKGKRSLFTGKASTLKGATAIGKGLEAGNNRAFFNKTLFEFVEHRGFVESDHLHHADAPLWREEVFDEGMKKIFQEELERLNRPESTVGFDETALNNLNKPKKPKPENPLEVNRLYDDAIDDLKVDDLELEALGKDVEFNTHQTRLQSEDYLDKAIEKLKTCFFGG